MKALRKSKKSTVPHSWERLLSSLQECSRVIAGNTFENRILRNKVREQIEEFHTLFSTEQVEIQFPDGIPKKLETQVTKVIKTIRSNQSEVIADLENFVEHFIAEDKHENKLTVLVFGKTNSGKTALANHITGLDYGLKKNVARCFVNESKVDRLRELPTECTKDYQGFELPGLLWIDCPGVLSVTQENYQLAHELVGRADIILFVTPSNDPLTESQLEELKKLIDKSGNNHIDGFLVITKADSIEEEQIDDEVIKVLKSKHSSNISAQKTWSEEQLEKIHKSGLSGVIKMGSPMFLSVYVGRQKLGRDCDSGDFLEHPGSNWEQEYLESGFTEFYDTLSEKIQAEGAEIKRRWTIKRRMALNSILRETTRKSVSELDNLLNQIKDERDRFHKTKKDVKELAISSASTGVNALLQKHHINEFSKFDSEAAGKSLQKHLAKSITESFVKYAEPALKESLKHLDQALNEYLTKTSIKLSLTQLKKKVKSTSSYRGEAGGSFIGGTGFSIIGGMVGGPFGAILGGVLGGLLGGLIGGEVYQRTEIIEVPAGTNSEQVIKDSIDLMKDQAGKIVDSVYSGLEDAVFDTIITAIKQTKSQVEKWEREIK